MAHVDHDTIEAAGLRGGVDGGGVLRVVEVDGDGDGGGGGGGVCGGAEEGGGVGLCPGEEEKHGGGVFGFGGADGRENAFDVVLGVESQLKRRYA